MSKTVGFTICVSGAALTAVIREMVLGLPEDALLIKVVPSQDMSYCFDVLFASREGWEVGEGASFPRIQKVEDLPFKREEE